MKQYKLIKEYPNSPKLHSIYEEIRGKYERESGRMYRNLKKEGSCLVDSRDIEPYIDFWEEIIQKEYEILSWKYNNKIFSLLNSNSSREYVYCKEGTWMGYNRLVANPDKDYSIHSVKRLSDGEIFTVGDILDGEDYIKGYILQEFEPTISSMKVWYIDPGYSCPTKPSTTSSGFPIGNMHYTNLKYIKLYKKPLFTTEDGVEIFEGDDYYSVQKESFTVYKNKAINGTSNKYLDFSTKAAAEEYILMNKPCLSINDILNNSFLWKDTPLQALQKIVRKKQ